MNETLRHAIDDERIRNPPKRTVPLQVRMDDEVHKALDAVAKREGLSLNGLIVAVLRRALGVV